MIMYYCFIPSNDRRVVYVSHNYHINPELHPSRLMKDHDIFYVVDGYCSVRLEDEELHINPGEIAVLPANHPHYAYKHYRANTHTIFIHFTFCEGDHKMGENETAPKNAIIVKSSVHARSPLIFHYFQELERIYWSEISHRELRCSAIICLLLMEMHNSHKNQVIKQDQIILELLSLITDHPQRFYTISELANEANISPKSLSYRFKAETGQTVHQYQLNKKLNQVAALLRSEFFTKLKSLADNFGFYDEFHLSSSFKKKFGISPKEFSRNLEYAFDSSIIGSKTYYDGILKSSDIVHITNDNVQLISTKKLEGKIIRILLQFREFKGNNSNVQLQLNVTADTAYLWDVNGVLMPDTCTLSDDGRVLSFSIHPFSIVTVVLELMKNKKP